MNCFWCNKSLEKKEETKDHLFSNFIRRNFSVKNPYCVHSCYECNHLRGFISCVFEIVYRHRLNKWEDWKAGNPPKNISKIVNKCLKKTPIRNFRNKIKRIKDEYVKQYCLMEIDELFTFLSLQHSSN